MTEAAKQPALFDEKLLEPVDLTQIVLDGPPLRIVYFDVTDDESGQITTEDDKPCLVRCDGGERNVKSVRRLATLCERACKEATRTSAIPPSKLTYCQTCLSRAGNGVLK